MGVCPVGCAVFAYRYLDIDWQEAAQVTWAAGTSEPRLAGGVAIGIEGILAIARQWVWIEESATIHAQSDPHRPLPWPL